MSGNVSKLPCQYVDYLCKPGLKTRGGVVPLQMYMSINKNGQNSSSFLSTLFAAKLADLDDPSWSPTSCVPYDELIIMMKGQGNDAYYVKLWDWLWDNQEQLGGSKFPLLRQVYDRYFVRKTGGPNPLLGMVKDAYFGMECIGFVSNYLRWVKVWEKYQGVGNHQWSTHFKEKVQDLADVRPLDLLEWKDVGHIALVDAVNGISKGKLTLDISQCSAFQGGLKGPMSNEGVTLTAAEQKDPAHRVFTIGGLAPVGGDLQIRRMSGLSYKAMKFARQPNTSDKKGGEYARRN